VHEVPGESERIFVRVVEAGSLKAAAGQLGTDASTVSRRVAALEARLGVKLLQRSTRRTSPTDAGARYHEGLRRLLDQEAALEAEVAGNADALRGRLRVTAAAEFGTRFVVPVVEALHREAPDLEIELLLGSAFVDLAEEGVDVAVRVGRLADSSLVARRLGVVPRVLVASPKYLRRHGTPRRPDDLAKHEMIFYARANARELDLGGPDGPVTARLNGRLTLNSVAGIRALVEAGRGIHLGPLWAFHDSIEAGRLHRLLPSWSLRAYPLHAVYPPSAYVPAKIRAFVDRMASLVRGEPSLAAEPR
jgi:DNA-binding transcriptional LysR family regulator